MNILMTPHIDIWNEGSEYGYLLDFQDENMCEILSIDRVIEGRANNYTSAINTINSKIKAYALKRHKYSLDYQQQY